MTDVKTQEIIDFASKGTIKDGLLKMPVLYSRDAGDKFRLWEIVVGITTTQIKPSLKDTNGDWLAKMKFIPVTQSLIEREDLPEDAVGVYWTYSGQEGTDKPKTTKPTYILKGTNIGKRNYTTAFTNAIRRVMTQLNNKIKKGAQFDKSLLKSRHELYTMDELFKLKHRGETPWRVFVQAFHNVDKNWAKVTFPCYVQPKYDGTRLCIVHHPLLPDTTVKILADAKKDKTIEHVIKLDYYSRGSRTRYEGQEHIIMALNEVMKEYPGLHLDGELWKKGYSLQEISGSSRREKESDREEAVKLEYHVFDCFYLDNPLTFKERQAVLDDLFDSLDAWFSELTKEEKKVRGLYQDSQDMIVRVPTQKVDDKEELMNIYKSYLDEGLEGAMIYKSSGVYKVGIDKEERTYDAMKLKPREDAEWPVVGIDQGKGGHAGLILFVCEHKWTTKTGIEKSKIFRNQPNWTDEKRRAAWNYFQKHPNIFEKEFKGQMATLSYHVKSIDGLPQQPKFLRFRDPKIDERLNELLS